MPDVTVTPVGEADLGELLPLVRSYLDFYESSPADAPLIAPGAGPTDEAMRSLSHALIADPETEGVQFLARDGDGRAVGFATLFWTWSTTSGGRLGVMNDLFVAADGRGSGAAEALIEACRARCAQRGAVALAWVTARDNVRAQKVYDRVGGERDERWLDYSLDV
ncbi:MAG: GNAT family N-acetyltransferase [Solirubrobacteraceae bacterium]